MSKESRLAAKKRSQQAKAKRIRNRLIKVVLVLVIICLAGFIGYRIYENQFDKKVDASTLLTDEGLIKNVDAKSCVDLVDYKNIKFDRNELLSTESEVNEAVDNVVNSLAEDVATAGQAIKEDSVVKLTYKVSVDGKEDESLKADNRPYTLGTETYTKAFDSAIAELTVGDPFSIEIEFPADYDSIEALTGKTAVFEGKIDSCRVIPELTDELVATNDDLKDYMKDSKFEATADGLKKFCGNKLYENALDEKLTTYIIDESKVKKNPFWYTKARVIMADVQYKNQFVQTNQMYESYIGQPAYESVLEMLQLDSEKAYEKKCKEDAKLYVKNALVYQAIFEDAGLDAITEADIRALLTDESTSYETAVENYGKGFLAQAALQEKVYEYVKTLVTVEGDEVYWKAN